MRIRQFMMAVGLLVAAAVTASGLISATPAGALPNHRCGPGMYWNAADNACDDLPPPPPPGPPPAPTPAPAPTLGPPFHQVCDFIFCTEYVSRTATRAISAQFDAYQNTLNASVASVGAAVCVVMGAGGVVPGLVCAALFGLASIDLGYTIDRYHYAAANNLCVRVPQWIPWVDPIPDNGPECFN